jgi:asparagine synthase (glutamine-hydrolysing)
MCGFIGYFSPVNNVSSESIRSSLDSIAHRGPDDEGIISFKLGLNELCLTHRRLSIIDLTSNGHQPFFDNSGRYTIIFNGEIYNYQELREELELFGIIFRTKTDTEVLLEAWKFWGDNCWPKFSGMFSVAIFDIEKQNLILVRDAFGIKPLYYYTNSTSLYFASEIPAILKIVPTIPYLNLQRAYEYLIFDNYDNDESTFFESIHQLKPGHFIKFDLKDFTNEIKQFRWWLPDILQKSKLNFNDATEKLRDLFLQSVRLHLRSDVPIGAALSGGVDSSAIVCAIRHLEPQMPIHTFTYIANDSKINEEKWANIVNNKVNANVNKVFVNSNELVDDLNDLIKIQGEPFSGTSIYAQYRIFKKAKEQGIIVTLDGQGADELLGGYYGYPDKKIQSLLFSNQWAKSIDFSKYWAKRSNRSPLDPWKHLLATKIPNRFFYSVAKVFGRFETPVWLNTKYLSENAVFLRYPERIKIVDSYDRKLVEQLANELVALRVPRLLRYSDRNSMRFSIESRVPFLTTELANFTYSLPESYLVSDEAESKHIFRHAMRNIVPDEILDRKDKIGFETPEIELIKSLHKPFKKILNSTKEIPFLNKELLIKFYDDDFFNSPSNNNIHWRLFNLLIWINLFDVKCK